MKKIKAPLIIIAACSVLLNSCGMGELNTKAEASANSFFANVQQKNYPAAISLCSSKAFEADTKEAWTKALERNAGLLGEIQSFTKVNKGYNIATSTTSGTTITEAYDVQWQYGKSLDSVVLIKEKDGSMKVYSYGWKVKEAKYLSAINDSEKEAKEYMEAVKSGNYDAAIAFCSEGALNATPKDQWAIFLDRAKSKFGGISGYAVVPDSSSYHIEAKGESGIGNYYDIYVQSDRGGNKVMEKMVFFQKNYSEPVKLAGHYFL